MNRHDEHNNNDQGHDGDDHDHSQHHEMMAQDFKRRFFISLALSVPVLLLSPTIQDWFGFQLPAFTGSNILLFALASMIALWGAKPFYTGAVDELKKKRLGMMVLVSIAVGAGYLYSVATTFFIPGIDFYWEISTLVVFLLFGHWMEMRSVIGASGALRELAELIPPKANKIEGDGEIAEVKTETLEKGDVILVRPGEKVPIDGEVVEGSSNVNEAMVTGESKPVSKEVGDEVIGGTINSDGVLRVKVTRTGEETAVAQIIGMVKSAQSSKPETQNLADKAAHYLTLIAIFVGLGTLFAWAFIFDAGFLFALTLAMTVVVITCPHALGLAIPIVTTITTSTAAKNGILIKNMEAIERIPDVDYVLFDKTGTLTEGNFGVSEVVLLDDEFDRGDVLSMAAGLDVNSDHVIAKSIVQAAKDDGIDLADVKDFKYESGRGAIGTLDGDRLLLGNRGLLEKYDIDVGINNKELKAVKEKGRTVVYLACGEKLIGAIGLADTIKDDARKTIDALHERDIRIAMVTGDNEAVATHVADELGIDVYFSEVLPEDKVDKVKELQSDGSVVMMVGDGINDAPALVQSDVGVAIGAGTDVAIASAEIVLVNSNPSDVLRLVDLAKATMRKMKENLLWATGYNVIAIPMAAGVLAPWGIMLRPEWGALVMSASSIIVVANALLLKKQAFDGVDA